MTMAGDSPSSPILDADERVRALAARAAKRRDLGSRRLALGYGRPAAEEAMAIQRAAAETKGREACLVLLSGKARAEGTTTRLAVPPKRPRASW